MRPTLLALALVGCGFGCAAAHEVDRTNADGGARDGGAGDAPAPSSHVCPAGSACALPDGSLGTCCDHECVDLTSNASHCGGCGAACPAGVGCDHGCVLGNCDPPAVDGWGCTRVSGRSGRCAGGTCHDPNDFAFDPLNCGLSGAVCPLGDACSNGSCGDARSCEDLSPCPVGTICWSPSRVCVPTSCTERLEGSTCATDASSVRTCCGGSCVDRFADPQNCGGCGVVCPADSECLLGVCRPLTDCSTPGGEYRCGLPDGRTGSCCGTHCVDPAICDSCFVECPVAARCSVIEFPPPLLPVGECVIDNPDGGVTPVGCASSADCPSGSQCDAVAHLCVQGECGADGDGCSLPGASPGVCCGGECVDPTRDPNCGGCGRACASGVCTRLTYLGGLVLGEAVVTCLPAAGGTTDCAAFGCPEPATCVDGVCLVRGCDTSGLCLANDGRPGRCCNADGARSCIDLTSDNANCGDCGRACGSGQTCSRGRCS